MEPEIQYGRNPAAQRYPSPSDKTFIGENSQWWIWIWKNTLLEINFENARCTYDTNMNRYVTKKKSQGKVDMVAALINAVYLLQQDVIFNDDWVVQVI